MGLFNWIGQVFSKKEKVELMVAFNDLEDWVDNNTKGLVKENLEEVNKKYDEIIDKRTETQKLLKNLAEAKLHNANIEPRILQFMTGNRDNYIQQIKIFLNNFPALNDDFYPKLQDALTELTKKTGRSYQILQEFFANETKSIAIKLKEMDILSREINKFKKSSDMNKVSEIKQKIKEIIDMKALGEDLIDKIDASDSKLSECKNKLEQLSKELDEKKKSKEYDDYNMLIADREKLGVKLKMLDNEVNELFSALKRVFKKYRKITLSNEYEALIDKYLESPLIGLIDDRTFQVLKLLEEIDRKMNSLNIDEKEQSRVRNQIEAVTKEKLDDFLKKYDELKKQLVLIKEELDKNTILQEIEKLEQEIDAYKQSANRAETELEDYNNKKSQANVEERIKELQLLINESLGSNICIK